ncbi:hypothetical protein ACROYT_G017975 [Oculina patagonica]
MDKSCAAGASKRSHKREIIKIKVKQEQGKQGQLYRQLIMVILVGVMSLPGSSACSARRRQKFTDSQLLQRIRQRYLFVENRLVVHSSNHTQINGGINFKTGQKTGTSKCPWIWAIDDDPDRIPRYLAKAECPQCNHYCRAVFYTHNSLVQRCDRKTGTIFWTRMERTLQIAYVYDH